MPELDIEAELRAIREANEGILTAQAIVIAATPEEHPLHSRFEWDADKAAEKYRLQQAHNLVRVVRLQYINKRGEPDSMRVFHSLPDGQSPTGRSYQPLDIIQRDQIMSQTVKRQMEVDWRAMKRRYSQFSDFMIMIRREMGLESDQEGTEPLALDEAL